MTRIAGRPSGRRRRIAALLLPVALLVGAPAGGVRAADWSITTTAQVPSHTFQPITAIANAGDGTNRLFVVERPGTVRVVEKGAVRAGYFLDIRSVVEDGGERGLLGLAFHPQFETNRRLYAFYTRNGGDIVIARYQATSDGRSVNAATYQPLLSIPHSSASNHNGGGLAFGPDGYLYIAVGDGGGSGDPENDSRSKTRNFLGKILRIDVNGSGAGPFKRYAIPTSNPYRGATSGLDEIWAFGLRNPWRITFDRVDGALYIGDVGQGQREEVNRQAVGQPGGRDYGWNVMEGTRCYRASACPLAGDTLPVAEYTHDGGNCSITGGYVYRGTDFPRLVRSYVFADYCSGRIWSMTAGGVNNEVQRADTALRITTFGEAEDGELYAGTIDGKLYRIGTT